MSGTQNIKDSKRTKPKSKEKKKEGNRNVETKSLPGASASQSETRKESPRKRPSDTAIIGYVQKLSPVKRNRRDTLDYVTMSLQTDNDEYQDVLCYSMAKRPILMTSMASHTPIKVDHFTKTKDGAKIIINDMTKVAVPDQTEYSIQYAEQIEVITDANTINCEKEPYDYVNIRSKVVRLLPETIVGREMRLRKGVFVDSTGAIQLQIWQDNIAEIEEGSMYTLTSTRVGAWNGQKYVGTTRQSNITACTSVEVIHIGEEEIERILKSERETTIEVKNFLSIESLSRYYECSNGRCSKKIMQASSGPVIHCDQCGRTTRASSCTTNTCAKIIVKHPENGKNFTLTLFGDALEGLVHGWSVHMDHPILAERLLMVGRVSLSYNSTTNVVSRVALL